MLADLQFLFDRLLLKWRNPEREHQVGAIPYAIVDGRVTFLLVTSRRSGRWIFPKGSIMKGLTPWETAAQEALEEAGVEGEVSPTCLGSYRTIKKTPLSRSVVEVDMYALRVTDQLQSWQEMKSRRRHWVLLPEARRLLGDPDLADIAAKLNRALLSTSQPPTTVRIKA